ncbi:MAG: DUF4249 family protein [Bacteroidia bacterium]|nr:DUF4249 family protein [Bacteroidia bacterium]
MKINIKYFFRNIIIAAICISCEKDITVELSKPENKIVIEGAIEQGQHPYIFITRNAAYFEPVNDSTLFNMIILDATVIVSDGTITDTIIQTTIDPYTVPFFKYISTKIIGEIGKTYYLTVHFENRTYTARTFIPPPVILDSIAFKETNEVSVDSVGTLWLYFTDPDTLGNYYRYFTKTLGKDSVFVHPVGSVSDDKIINGQFIEFLAYRGWNPNLTEEQREAELEALGDIPRWAFVRGETVVMKFCSIDAAHYHFWRTVELQNSTDGNPFATPNSVVTNIEGGALGIWGGYGAYYDTLKIN